MKINTPKIYPLFSKKNPVINPRHGSIPMQKFKKEVRLPSMPKDPKISFQKNLIRQSEHHKNIGRSFERLKNPKAAIRAYENAKYLDPDNVALSKVTTRIKVNLIRNLKA